MFEYTIHPETLEYIGWIGSIAFAICGLPQAYNSYKTGNSRGSSFGFLFLWLIGEVFTLVYVYPKSHEPLIFQLIWNIIFILIILRYKIWERDEGQQTIHKSY
jgi:uncharacterized protein with PQ loop repeat